MRKQDGNGEVLFSARRRCRHGSVRVKGCEARKRNVIARCFFGRGENGADKLRLSLGKGGVAPVVCGGDVLLNKRLNLSLALGGLDAWDGQLGGIVGTAACKRTQLLCISGHGSLKSSWVLARKAVYRLCVLDGLEAQAGHGVVLQVLADIGVVNDDVDAQLGQELRIANARVLKDPGAVDGAGGEDNLLARRGLSLAVLDVLDTLGGDCAAVFGKDNLAHRSASHDDEVLPSASRLEIGVSSVAPRLGGGMDAVRNGYRAAGLLGVRFSSLLEPQAAQRLLPDLGPAVVDILGEAELKRAIAGGGPCGRGQGVGFGQRFGEACPVPAGVPKLGPSVHVGLGRGREGQAVDGTRSTEELALGEGDLTVVEAGLKRWMISIPSRGNSTCFVFFSLT